jgi:YD repeat-containing protein
MCTVTATYLQPDGATPCTGRVTAGLVAATYHDGVDAIFPPVTVSDVLDSDGSISLDLLPTVGDDAQFDATGMTYQITERINGSPVRVYWIDVPSTPAADLGTLATYTDPPGTTRSLVEVSVDGFDYAAANPVITITYNGDDSIATVTENGVVTSFTYNGDGTVATSTRLGVVRTFTYNGAGNLTSVA